MSLFNNQWIWKDVAALLQSKRTFDAICILGPPGIGKTFQMQQIVEHMGLDAYWIHSSNCNNAKEMRDMIQKGLKTNLLSNLAQTVSTKVVIIDELEVFLQMDRMMTSALTDAFADYRTALGFIILLGDSILERKIANMKGNIKIYECCMPSAADMYLWCKERAPKGIKKTVLMEIAESSNGNPGYALNILQSKTVSGVGMQEKVPISEATRIRNKLYDDPWLYPLRFHENLMKELAKKKGTKQQKTDIYVQCLDMLCEWDFMMGASIDPLCAMEHVWNAMTVVFPQLEYKKSSPKDTSMDDFTKIFSNLSLQKKQERNLHANNLDFPWMDAHIMCDYKRWK